MPVDPKQIVAARSANPATRALGGAMVLLGLVVAAFSCLSWAANDVGGISISISGLGKVSVDADGSGPSYAAAAGTEMEKFTSAAGITTLILGILLVIAGILLAVNIFPGVAAIVSSVLALGSLIYAFVVALDPLRVLVDMPNSEEGGNGMSDVGYGLWLVLFGSLLALVVAVVAIMMSAKVPRAQDAQQLLH